MGSTTLFSTSQELESISMMVLEAGLRSCTTYCLTHAEKVAIMALSIPGTDYHTSQHSMMECQAQSRREMMSTIISLWPITPLMVVAWTMTMAVLTTTFTTTSACMVGTSRISMAIPSAASATFMSSHKSTV